MVLVTRKMLEWGGVWETRGERGEATKKKKKIPCLKWKTREEINYLRSLRTTLAPEDKELQPQFVLG